jgi:hypothetical protein
VPLWWFGMFVASMTPEAPRRLAIDLDGYFLPRYVYASTRLAAGSLALWNADELAGVPLLGTGQTAVLYPPRIVLFGLLPPLPALHAFMLLHYVLLAVGSFAFWRWACRGGPRAIGDLPAVHAERPLRHRSPPRLDAAGAGERHAPRRVRRPLGCALAAAASMRCGHYPETPDTASARRARGPHADGAARVVRAAGTICSASRSRLRAP